MLIKHNFKVIYDQIYEMITDMQYVYNLSTVDTLVLTDKIVLIYNYNIKINTDGFGKDLQEYINLIDDTLKVELEVYDDRFQFIIMSKF